MLNSRRSKEALLYVPLQYNTFGIIYTPVPFYVYVYDVSWQNTFHMHHVSVCCAINISFQATGDTGQSLISVAVNNIIPRVSSVSAIPNCLSMLAWSTIVKKRKNDRLVQGNQKKEEKTRYLLPCQRICLQVGFQTDQ